MRALSSRRASLRRSCDRCFTKKNKCTFDPFDDTCTQCKRSQTKCTTLRAECRPGRRPRQGGLGPNAFLHVWEVTVSSTSQPDSTSLNIVHNQPRSTNDADASRVPDGSKAADNSTHTPVEPQSRQPRPSSMFPYVSSDPHLSYLVTLQPANLGQFFCINDVFMHTPAFALQFQSALRYSTRCSAISLDRSFQAMFSALLWARHFAITWDQVNIQSGAISLRHLRVASVTSTEEGLAIAMFGQTLAAFDAITTCRGSALILRHSLTLFKPWYPTLTSNPFAETITTAPIFWDTVNCLLTRQVPIIKYEGPGVQAIDRVAGICTTLIPILYDLCLVSNQLQSTRDSSALTALQDIRGRVLRWPSTFQGDLGGTFSDSEMDAIQTQARMYRIATLLLIHRIWRGDGVENQRATSYAHQIFLELSTYQGTAIPKKKLLHVVFPVFVAMLETPDVPPGIWDTLSLLCVAPMCMQKLSSLIEAYWRRRQDGYTGSFFDVIRADVDFVMVP